MFFLCVFICLSSFTLKALDPKKAITQYKLEAWGTEQGYPLNVVFSILQTPNGYIWLGTRDGLVRFDGVGFKVFNKSNTAGLNCTVVRALCLDRSGALWIGTYEEGLSRLKEGKFTNYSVDEYPALKSILAISEDYDNCLWMGTKNNGLIRLKNGRFTSYPAADGLAKGPVESILAEKRGRLWIGSSAGLSDITISGEILRYSQQTWLPADWVYCLYKKENGELWISGINGLYRKDADNITHFKLHGVMSPPRVLAMREDSDRNFWIGSDGSGLARLKNGKFEMFSIADGMKCDNIFSIYEDREGSLWLGTLQGGLHQLRDPLFTVYTDKEGLSHEAIRSIYEDREGSVWIGTLAGLNRLKENKLTLEFNTGNGLLNNNVDSILEDRAGRLWIATSGGLHRLKEGKLSRFTSKNGLSHNLTVCLLEDRQGAVWIGTLKGLSRFYKGKFSIFNEKSGLSHPSIMCLLEDREGNIWIGTENGLNRFRNGKFTSFTNSDGLAGNSVECVFESKEGVLYTGTRSGLSRMAGGKFFNYTSRSGLITSRVNYILEDDAGYLWLVGPSGISRVKKKELDDFAAGKIEKLQPVNYNEQDGMKTRWCTNRGMKSSDGRLWFATERGVVVIDPANIRQNTQPPPVVIEKIIVDGKTINVGGLLTGPREETSFLLPPETRRLEIYYSAPSFVKPREIKFKIKMIGYDTRWLDMGNTRITNYTGLSPGEYTFTVIACNADGIWNEKGASISFYKKAFWYETRWAFLGYALFLLLTIVSFVKWRSWKLLREKKRLEGIVKERTTEIKGKNKQLEIQTQQLQKQSKKLKEMDEIKSRFFANISHEFRTPLTLIMGPLEQRLGECSDQRQIEEMRMMLRNSRRLLTLINQLLDLSKLESGGMQLQAARQDIIPFLKGLVYSFESLAQQQRLDLTFLSEQENIFLYYDAEKLEKVIVNLIANAVKFTPDRGKITVTAAEKPAEENFPGGYLEIKVSDTGIGIPGDDLAYVFDRFYQAGKSTDRRRKGTGIGLALAKELVDIHYGEIAVHSREGKGSEFTIRLPLGKDHLKPEEITPGPPPVKASETGHNRLEEIEHEAIIEDEKETGAEELEKEEQEKDVILVVEDNPDVRKYIRGPLEPLYRVMEAVNGKAGIEKAKKIIPDLIVSDIMMPEVDGYQLCDTLKKDVKTSHIPIILLTAKASDESKLQGLQTGADDYITKPFNTRMLLTRIKNLIDLRRGLQEKIQRDLVLQPTEIAVSSVDQQFMEELKKAIEKNISDENFGVDELGKALYMSRATVNRKIRAITGESTNQFIQSYRLKRAAQLLKENFGNVTEVSFAVGFSSSAYFAKCFKEKFHQAPHAFQAAEAER